MTDTRYIEDLRRRYNAGAKLKFVNFWGHQPAKHGITASCFSQWYGAPFEIEGQRYPTAEHYMMAEKARLFGDEATRALVFKAPNPGAAKALGRQVMGFNDETWLAITQRMSTTARRPTRVRSSSSTTPSSTMCPPSTNYATSPRAAAATTTAACGSNECPSPA